MNRKISFTSTGAILVETEIATEVIQSGLVLLTLEQAREAIHHGWKLDNSLKPFSKETTPWLYAVRKGVKYAG